MILYIMYYIHYICHISSIIHYIYFIPTFVYKYIYFSSIITQNVPDTHSIPIQLDNCPEGAKLCLKYNMCSCPSDPKTSQHLEDTTEVLWGSTGKQ